MSLILSILLEEKHDCALYLVSFHDVIKGYYYIYMLHSVSQIHVDMIFGVPVIKKITASHFNPS